MFHIRDVLTIWQSFFYSPEAPTSLAVFRIVWGVLLFLNAALMVKDIEPFFGPNGYLPAYRQRNLFGKTRFSLFLLLPETILVVQLLFSMHLVCCLTLAIGFYTRTSAAITFLTMLSLHHRNPCVFHSGDTFMRLLTFLLIFSHAGDAYSVDRWTSDLSAETPLVSPWCLRLLQIQICLVYLRTVFWKLRGKMWPQGVAAYYPTQLESFQRLKLPRKMCNLLWIRCATWGTLAVQLAFASLVWFEETRYPALLAGIVLHLTFEFFLNLQLFSWTMIASYIVFVPVADMEWLFG